MSFSQADLPILTDVVERPTAVSASVTRGGEAGAGRGDKPKILADALPLPVPEISEERVAQRVLAELLRQADLIPEQRLRDVLTPTLERCVDILIHDARLELSATLRELVKQELERTRGS